MTEVAEGRIIVDIDESQLDAIRAKLASISTVAKSTTGSSRLDLKLPTINRELRILLGQLPGMREAMQIYFRIRRLERGMVVGDITLILTLIATAVVLFREIQRMQRDIERRQQQYESRIRKARGWTQEQFKAGIKQWQETARRQPG